MIVASIDFYPNRLCEKPELSVVRLVHFARDSEPLVNQEGAIEKGYVVVLYSCFQHVKIERIPIGGLA